MFGGVALPVDAKECYNSAFATTQWSISNSLGDTPCVQKATHTPVPKCAHKLLVTQVNAVQLNTVI